MMEQDLQDIYYFWVHKGDLTRWVGWEECLPKLKEHWPELLQAYEAYNAALAQANAAGNVLTAVIKARVD